MRYWAASMASITAKTLFWSEEKCEGKRGLSLDVWLDFRFTWFSGLTGRSEAVLSKYLILWFNALFKGTEGAQISIENDGRCRQISHQIQDRWQDTNKTGTGRIFCRHAEGLFQNSISTDIHVIMQWLKSCSFCSQMWIFCNILVQKPLFNKCYKEQ